MQSIRAYILVLSDDDSHPARVPGAELPIKGVDLVSFGGVGGLSCNGSPSSAHHKDQGIPKRFVNSRAQASGGAVLFAPAAGGAKPGNMFSPSSSGTLDFLAAAVIPLKTSSAADIVVALMQVGSGGPRARPRRRARWAPAILAARDAGRERRLREHVRKAGTWNMVGCGAR